MNSIIKELSEIGITSPEALVGVMGLLNTVLKGSTAFSIQTGGQVSKPLS